VTAVTLPKYRQ